MTAVERVFSLADLPPEEDPNAEISRDKVIENKATRLKGNFFAGLGILVGCIKSATSGIEDLNH